MVEAALATFTQHNTHTIDFGVVACLFACLLISFRYARLSQLGKYGSRCMLTSLLSLHYSRYICSMFHLQRVCRVSLLFFFHFAHCAIVYMDGFPVDSIKATNCFQTTFCLLCSIFAIVT